MSAKVQPLPPDPLSVFRPLVEGIGGLDQADRVRRGATLLQTLPRPPVGLTPHRVIHRQNKLVVRYYAPDPAKAAGRPVVVVPSMINRAYIVDLEPDRSMVGALAAAGHPTYLVDWGVPGPEDAQDDVGHVLLTLLRRSIDRIRRHARELQRAAGGSGSSELPQVHLLGYCQGGTLSAMYAALRPQDVAGLVALNAPVRFSQGGRFADFVASGHFDVEQAISPDALVPVEVMKVAFKLLDPMGNWTKHLAIEQASHDPKALARTLARERWLEENVPMPGTFARQFIRAAYQEDRLLAGTWVVRGQPVDLRRITCPVLVAACQRDFISPKEACLPLAQATGSADVTTEVLQTGHIGVVVGGFGPKVFFPMLDRWFRRVDGGRPPVAPARPGEGGDDARGDL